MRHVILYGFNFIGKTFFGKQLSKNFLIPFIDIDKTIEKLFFNKYKYNLSYKDIYKQKGNNFFRNLETQACFTLIKSPPSIVALGGGSLMKNFDFLITQGKGIYLKCSFDFIYQRLHKIGIPNIFKDLNKKSIHEIFNKRCFFYESFPNKHTIYINEFLNKEQILKQLEEILWETIPLELH